MDSVKVIVGSLNPLKVEGVRKAFLQYFERIEVNAVKAKSGVSKQPFNADVVKGAVNRALGVYEPSYDFSVGVEAGLFSLKNSITGFLDFQVAVVYNGHRMSIGFGPGFEYPPLVIDEVLKGKEVGSIMEKITGIKNIGRKTGAIHFLTKGIISRIDLTKIAVTMALIPWVNKELYRFKF